MICTEIYFVNDKVHLASDKVHLVDYRVHIVKDKVHLVRSDFVTMRKLGMRDLKNAHCKRMHLVLPNLHHIVQINSDIVKCK